MQKINFLPQVKAWNRIEFASCPTKGITPVENGVMTFDASDNDFKVSLQNDGTAGYNWKTILVGDSSNAYVSSISLLHAGSNIPDYDGSGEVVLYTQSAYNDTSNRLATMADITSLSTGVADVYVNGITVVSSGIARLVTDPSSAAYDDSSNQIATVDTVTNAINALGRVLRLRQIYDPATIAGIIETPVTIHNFEEWLEYCDEHASSTPSYDFYLHSDASHWNTKRGDVCIWGNEEYVFKSNTPSDAADIDNWELFGTLTLNTGVVSIGGATGVIGITNSFLMDGSTLTLKAGTDNILGGFKTAHIDSSFVDSTITKYTFGLKADSSNNGKVDIPVQNGKIEAGLLDTATYTTFMNAVNYSNTTSVAIIKPSTISATYTNVHSVTIGHDLGTSNVFVSVYKNRNVSANSLQAVYADEVITDASTVTVSFGSAEAFIGCQDGTAPNYYGYTVLISAPKYTTPIPDASITGIVS